MEIFAQLGVNNSLLYQTVIILVVLVISKILFLNHLEKVLVQREEKTVGLEENAEKQFEEIDKLKTQYDKKMASAHKEIKSYMDQEKQGIIKNLETKYRTEEHKVNTVLDEKRKEAQKEVESQKESILAQSDELSNLLVQKITKGS